MSRKSKRLSRRRSRSPTARNLYGHPLKPCSRPNDALTGYSREGTCNAASNDHGRHHVCLKLQESPDFCAATGQPDWCATPHECHGDATRSCPIRNWCVCEWAFASYVDAVGCDQVGTVDCAATNAAVLAHYRRRTDDPKVAKALRCLQHRCALK